MKNILRILLCLVVISAFSSCRKDACEPADLQPTHTYWISDKTNPVGNVVENVFEFYIYDKINQLTYYKAQQFAGCQVQELVNFVDETDDEVYKFSFSCVVYDKKGKPLNRTYEVLSYKDRKTVTDEGKYLESSISEFDTDTGVLIKKYEDIRVMDRDRLIER